MRFLSGALFLLLTMTSPVRGDFMQALSAYDAGDYGAAFSEWRRLAEQDDTEAQVALAGLYEAGLGTRQDFAAAARWYQRAAEQGRTIAALNLGDMYAAGRGVERNPVLAWVWLHWAARAGNTWAQSRRDAVAVDMTAAQRAEARAQLNRVHR